MSRKGNNQFKFKQFLVTQAEVGMKVTTEGCILGGWVHSGLKPERILDIGTGTGLLALMMAQKFQEAYIDAVEIDEKACHTARQNIVNSPWSNRVNIYHTDVQSFAVSQRYDLIICNPPFYSNSLRSDSESINRARHDDSLSKPDLLKSIMSLLASDGQCYVLYPPVEADRLIKYLDNCELKLQSELIIYNSPADTEKGPLRKILRLAIGGQTLASEKLLIKNMDGSYSPEFTMLLKDYYLYL